LQIVFLSVPERKFQMAKLVLHLAVDPESGGELTTIAVTSDRSAILHAAGAAIKESRDEITRLDREDRLLGQLQRGECARLQAALELAVPELRTSSAAN
jgi:hypothetical protein